ncbi:Uncharacterised protein [uncultured archaeon]|nr:Uncharacterised protein [uncultured archaeon]
MTNDDSCNLDKLKEEYEKIRLKHGLPEFYELNKLFDIEETEAETDFLLRKIRRTIAEKITGYSRFADIILNPSNAPMFFFKLIKKLDSGDKEVLSEIYEMLGTLELEMLTLDLDYSEEKEAQFVKKSFEVFNSQVRIRFLEVIKKLGNSDNNYKKENNGSYFG